jgi:hypothetical protein
MRSNKGTDRSSNKLHSRSIRRWEKSKSSAILRRRGLFEPLEERTLLSRTLFVDFGDYLPAGGLNMTVKQLYDSFASGGLQGPDFRDAAVAYTDATNVRFSPLSGLVDFDYNADGVTNGLDYSQLKANALSVVKSIYAPFDVDVQIAPAIDNSSSASYRAGVISQLSAADVGSTWVFCTAMTNVDTGTLVGDDMDSSGRAAGVDIGGTNSRTDSAVVNADYMLHAGYYFNNILARGQNADTALGDNIVHESGHTFGMQHIYDTSNSRSVMLANSEEMGYGLSWTQYGVFSRYPLLSDYELSPPYSNPGPAVIDYDRLADSDLLGVNSLGPAYVTGTGAFDTITITASGANRALVSIATYSDANHTTALAVPGGDATYVGHDGSTPTIYTASGNLFTYSVDTSNGILIDAGENSDWIVVDANLAAAVTIRGMDGTNRLEILGHGAVSGYYLPDSTAVPTLVTETSDGSPASTDLGGTIRVGDTTVNFQDYTSAGQVYVHDVTDFVYYTPNSEDAVTVDSPLAGQQRISGVSGGVATVPLVFSSVTNLTIDTGCFDGAGSGDDSIALAGDSLAAGLQSITINAGGGNDSLTIDDSNVFYSLANGIRYDGGTGFNSLTLTQTGGTAQTTDTYTVGPGTGEGSSVIVGPSGTQSVYFQNLAPVLDLVPAATLVVVGTPADNAINYSQGSQSTRGLVTIDNFESIEFSGKTALTIKGAAGSDEINLNNPATPTGLASITVDGGDPTGSDRVIVNGTTGADTIVVNQFTADGATVTGAQPVPVTLTTTEHLSIVGQGGNDSLTVTAPSGGSEFAFVPGATWDAASVTQFGYSLGATLLPLDYSALGASGSLTLAGPGSGLDIHGTSSDDRFDVSATGALRIFKPTFLVPVTLPIAASDMSLVRLIGEDGDDIFNVPADQPISVGIDVQGGDPAGSDTLNFTGSGSDVTVDLAAQTITENGFAPVSFSGIEVLNVAAAGAALTVNGTAGPDAFTYTPTDTTAGTVTLAGLNLAVNFTDVGGAFTVDSEAGTDHLTVNGTQASESIIVDATTVTVGALKAVSHVNAESLQINALAGNDTIDVTPSATTSIFVDGGDPIGSTPGDRIILRPLAAFAVESGPENDEGGLNSAGEQRVSWDHIEAVTVSGGGPALILGTNGEDEITIIARDESYDPLFADGIRDFTVSVNQGPNILFINQATLHIDALAGDDDIALREPAPNRAVWDVDLTVVGGPPAAPTGDSGDVFELETPGTQSIVFTPTGINTGTISDVTNSSLVTLTDSFTIAELYTSSPGGVEQVVYQGLDGNDTLAVNGTGSADTITVTPGPAADAGTLQVNNLLGLVYQGLGATATLLINGTGGADALVVNGTAANDAFEVVAAIGAVSLNANITILQNSIENLLLNGLAGDDVFQLHAGLPYTTTTISGGEPSASDVVSLTAATGPVTVDLADSTLPADNTTITGYGGTVTLTGVEVANMDANGNTVSVIGTSQDDKLTYTPSGAAAGTFRNAGLNTVFNVSGAAGSLTVYGGSGGNADEVIVQGTAARDLFKIDQGSALATVLANNVNALWPVQLATSIPVLTLQGLGGQDTFQVTPATGLGGSLDNLLINIDGGGNASGENNALVIQPSAGGTLDANQFVVVNRGLAADSGTVRVFTAAVQCPDVNYVNVQVVSPNVATVGGQPNLLILGPDANEPNEYQANAAFLGSGSTLQVAHASISPNNAEFPGVPGDNDYYRVVAETTGTLDFQVYFRVFDAALLPAGGNLSLQVLDGNGTIIASAPGAFGTVGTTANARVRIPAVAGQSYWLRVFGADAGGAANGAVINGYDVTIINSSNPVPANLELSRSVSATVAGSPDTGDLPANAAADDTGRSQFDNVTKVNNPTIYLRLDDSIFLQDLPGNQTSGGVSPMAAIPIPFNLATTINTNVAGFRIAIYDGGNGAAVAGNLHTLDSNDSTFIGFAQPVAGVPHLYALTIGTQGADSLADGLHYITARVQIIDPANPTQTGFGDRSQALQIVVDTVPPPAFFGTQTSTIDGIDPADTDTGVESYPATFVDRVTSDTRTGFWGTAEANAIVRVYSDQNNNGVVDAGDLLLGETTAVPVDGANAFPNGQWNLTTTIDLNDPAYFPHDGLRNLLVTGEDLAGNVSAPDALRIFIDTQGPQVTSVQITTDPGFNLFGLKADNAAQGPTPLVYSLSINVQDLPARSNADLNFLYDAVFVPVATTAGHYTLVGDANGVIPIQTITYVPGVVADGLPATGTIVLTFAQPLPDDRFTLTIDDSVVDVAGNKLDGESNAVEPNGAPDFPSGDGNPGGDFVARFTVDSRPEIGTWSAGSVYVDTNGNSTFDPTNLDYTNRDLVYSFGYSTDAVFSGNFSPNAAATADGFDKLAAYGKVGTQFRWIVDTNNDGVPDVVVNDPANINGLPVAGNFDGNAANGDEVGLFDGANWWLDTNHDFMVDTKIVSKLRGYPIVGNFDGDGTVDLATYQVNPTNKFFFDLGANGYGQVDATIDAASQFGYIGVRARPVAADMDRDGTTDVGLWIPDRSGATGDNIGEWSFLLSNFVTPTAGTVDTLNHQFSPTPLGHDVSARFGNEFARPVLGNFDPPVASAKIGPAISSVTLAVSGAKPAVTWTVNASSGIASTVFLVDGKVVSLSKSSASKTQANFSAALAGLNLSAGTHTFVIRTTDAAGKPITAECTGTFVIVGPTVKSVAVSIAKGVLTWNATSPNGMSGVALTVDNKPVSKIGAFTAGNYSAAIGLPAIGTHKYVITATDKNGKKVTFSGSFVVAAPTISNVTVAAAKGLVTWTAAASRGVASVALTIDGKRVSKTSGPNAAGNCYGSAGTLTAGTHKYVITVTDKGGKATTLSGSFAVAKSSKRASAGSISSAALTTLSDSAKLAWLYDLGGLTGTSSNTKKKTGSTAATDAVFAGY